MLVLKIWVKVENSYLYVTTENHQANYVFFSLTTLRAAKTTITLFRSGAMATNTRRFQISHFLRYFKVWKFVVHMVVSAAMREK